MFDSRQVKSKRKKIRKEHTQSHETVCANIILTCIITEGSVQTNPKRTPTG